MAGNAEKRGYMEIHLLSQETIGRIAAGEVVERPVNAAKELIENAIDAGASAITVEIKDGGQSLLRVTDNGCGIAQDQITKAFQRHATSKIRNEEDLSHLSSLGFRGEALASIAAVSQVEMITKVKDALTGTRAVNDRAAAAAATSENGTLEDTGAIMLQEIGAPNGTSVIVRNLFYNVPVRKKFLKQPQTEAGYITDLIERQALSHPDISFHYRVNGKEKLHTSGNGNLKELIYRIYGRETASSLFPVAFEQGDYKVTGLIGRPEISRSSRNYEIFFVNGRMLRSEVLSKAAEEGYGTDLMKHCFPFVVLHVTMPADGVDVNVHPTKMEVRFADTKGVYQAVKEAVHRTLHGKELIPAATLLSDREIKEQQKREQESREAVYAAGQAEPFETAREHGTASKSAPSSDLFFEKEEATLNSGSLLREKAPVYPPSGNAENGKSHKKAESEEFTFNDRREQQRTQDPTLKAKSSVTDFSASANSILKNDVTINTTPTNDAFSDAAPTNNTFSDAAPTNDIFSDAVPTDAASTEGLSTDSNIYPTGKAVQGELFSTSSLFIDKEENRPAILSKESVKEYRILGQIFETYWLVSFRDQLLMIDQHAAHEKVNYERFMKRFREKTEIPSQLLAPPIVLTLSGKEEASFLPYADVFKQMGFDIEPFGERSYALRAIPMDLYGNSPEQLFRETLEEMMDAKMEGTSQAILAKIASMSCKAAVKGNSKMQRAEAEALIDELLSLENPYHCPHGRPTMITLSKQEIERKFKRIV